MRRIKAPQRNARMVGIRARQQAKLGSILDQVHSDLIHEKTKGKPLCIQVIISERSNLCHQCTYVHAN